jgi:hypothetical protein
MSSRAVVLSDTHDTTIEKIDWQGAFQSDIDLR